MLSPIICKHPIFSSGVHQLKHAADIHCATHRPVVLERSFGFSPRISLVLSAADSMQWMFWAAMAYFVIERVGRYKLMLFGAAGCSMCFAVAAIGLGVGGNVANGVAVGFIFLYYFFYVSALFFSRICLS